MNLWKIFMLSFIAIKLADCQIKVNYPIRFTYINRFSSWTPEGIAKSMGIPGYSNHIYNYICITFWTCANGPLDIAKFWDDPISYVGTLFGNTNDAIRTNIKRKYKDAGITLMVSAFGATQMPTTAGANVNQCANRLADYVLKNQLEGVDLDWQDTAAFQSGVGEQWLIDFTKVIRTRLPDTIITHAPQAPYFGGRNLYPKNAYIFIQQTVGSMIQFYNVQFYNQVSTTYGTGQLLFNVSGGWANGTSVNQIIAKGIPSNKIVIGKAATLNDADIVSFMTAQQINKAILDNYPFNQWKTGLMFWQFFSDPNGTIIKQASAGLMQIYASLNITVPNNTNTTNSTNTTNTTITTNTTNTTNISSNNSIIYPIRLVYIDRILNWSTAQLLAKSLGVPGYATRHPYNYICLRTWTSSGLFDSAFLWNKPTTVLGIGSIFGKNDIQIRNKIKKIYNDNGIRLLISAFGKMQMPTSLGKDSTVLANNLAAFVINNNLDGVDIDWQDTNSFLAGIGQQWLINFTNRLRSLLPNLIITHAPQASYFIGTSVYKNNGYLAVNQVAGSSISFYNIQFFNQLTTTYNSGQSLFNSSGGWAIGTSVNEIIRKGIPRNKIVVGKNSLLNDGDPNSYMNSSSLSNAFISQFNSSRWNTGIAYWQYTSDPDGLICNQTITSLIKLSSIIINNPNIINTTNISNLTTMRTLRITYITKVLGWSSVQILARSLAVPGYTSQSIYNHLILGFWTINYGPVTACLLWDNPSIYFGTSSVFGKDNKSIRNSILQRYRSKGIKLFLGVFGNVQLPATMKADPVTSAIKLVDYVKLMGFDGIDINWNDHYAFKIGTAEAWIISFTKQVKELLPNIIISHSPISQYFASTNPGGGYIEINRQISSLILFYNVLYFNQPTNFVSNTSSLIFNQSSNILNVSINQLIARGISGNKLVIGKPATLADDVSKVQYINPSTLGQGLVAQYIFKKQICGVLLWQYSSDLNGSIIQSIISPLNQTLNGSII